MSKEFAAMLWAVAAGGLLSTPLAAQPVVLSQEAYLTPPKEIADAVLASRTGNQTLTNLSPDGKKFLLTRSDGMPTLRRLGQPHVYLAEVAFDTAAGRAHDLWLRSAVGYDVYYYADQRTVPVQVPDKARVSNPVWSPDGSKLAFYAHFEDATHIYIADVESGFSRRLTPTPVLATLVTSFQWSKDGKGIQTVLWPDDGKRDLPKRNGVPTEPKVRVARDGKQPSRTYRYLLESPHDMKLLEHLATGQLALIDIYDGKVTKVGFPNLLREVSMAPGDSQFRIATLKKPFSYFVPLMRFGAQEGIWDLEGKMLCALSDRNIQDTEPATAVATTPAPGAGRRGGRNPATAPDPTVTPAPDPTPDPVDPDNPARPGQAVDPNAKRAIAWRADGAGLSFLQLEPSKPAAPAPAGRSATPQSDARKDRVLQWLPPYGKEDVKVLYETPQRIINLQYSEDCRTLFLTQTIDNQRQISAIDLAEPKNIHVIYRSPARPANGPARPAANPSPTAGEDEQQLRRGGGFRVGQDDEPTLLTRMSRVQVPVVRISKSRDVYLSGIERPRDKDPRLPRPFLDKVSIKTGKKSRIFEGKGDLLETLDAVDSDDIQRVFTTRQKPNVVPDSYVIDLSSGKAVQLTKNVDPTPWYRTLQVQRFQVTRVDGFQFWVKVTTPPKPAGKLPALFWIYPREYTNQAAYNAAYARTNAQTANRFEAPDPRSMTLLTLRDYAVVEPDVPIVGPAGRINDNFIPDLRNSLWAVIDDLDKRGLIDRDRLAVGGHSYGAFSTANALAHTPFFKAGIAGDGNYNRTLTTMTFQAERRHFWDARDVYLEMSPLLWAHRVNGALLMYHGMDDANVGTNPINAEHMFLALDGLGKAAALYMYPYEGHGPLARETTLDLWARWVAWLDTYVKNPPGKKAEGKRG